MAKHTYQSAKDQRQQAVAMRYNDSQEQAPRVVAKGQVP